MGWAGTLGGGSEWFLRVPHLEILQLDLAVQNELRAPGKTAPLGMPTLQRARDQAAQIVIGCLFLPPSSLESCRCFKLLEERHPQALQHLRLRTGELAFDARVVHLIGQCLQASDHQSPLPYSGVFS